MISTRPPEAEATRKGQRRPSHTDGPGESVPSPKPRLLIVDDDPEILMALETYFEMEGYEVVSASDGGDALKLMGQEPGFDLVLLDVVLPTMSGFEVLRKSEEQGFTSPVLMISGRGDQENILRGFGLGAQDYIVKPFNPEDLVERTEALIGRDSAQREPFVRYQVGDYIIDFDRRKVTRNDTELDLSELELDILRCLIENRGCVVTKKRMLREAWRIDGDMIAYTINPDVAMEKVDRSVQSVRRKIEPDPSKPRFIHTVYGLGYRFTG